MSRQTATTKREENGGEADRAELASIAVEEDALTSDGNDEEEKRREISAAAAVVAATDTQTHTHTHPKPHRHTDDSYTGRTGEQHRAERQPQQLSREDIEREREIDREERRGSSAAAAAGSGVGGWLTDWQAGSLQRRSSSSR